MDDDADLFGRLVRRVHDQPFPAERAGVIAAAVAAIVDGVRRGAAAMAFDAEAASFLVELERE